MIEVTDTEATVINKMKLHYEFLKSLSRASSVQCNGRFMKTVDAMHFEISDALWQLAAWEAHNVSR